MADRWNDDVDLLAVFAARTAAEEVGERIVRVTGEPQRVDIGDPADDVRSVKAEMQEEVDRSWTSPQAGVVYPDEAARGLVITTVVGCAVGGLLLLPFGFISVTGVALWVRLLVMFSIGVLMGGTIALVAGPALAAKRPDDQLAAERGTVVRVHGSRDDVVELLMAREPLRLDRIRNDDGTRIDTVVGRHDVDNASVAKHIIERSVDPTNDADVQTGPDTTNRTTPPAT
jgi:hypothetical protein